VHGKSHVLCLFQQRPQLHRRGQRNGLWDLLNVALLAAGVARVGGEKLSPRSRAALKVAASRPLPIASKILCCPLLRRKHTTWRCWPIVAAVVDSMAASGWRRDYANSPFLLNSGWGIQLRRNVSQVCVPHAPWQAIFIPSDHPHVVGKGPLLA
jgi:hypothetical protein